jgi:ketosteroid isomerase-like protein
MTEKNLEAVRDAYAALNARDKSAWDAVIGSRDQALEAAGLSE